MTEKKSTKSQSNDSNITPVRSEAMLNKPRGNIGGNIGNCATANMDNCAAAIFSGYYFVD